MAHVLDLSTKKEVIAAKTARGGAWFLEFTPDDRMLVSASRFEIAATDVASGEIRWRKPVRAFSGGLWVRRLDISRDGTAVAFAVIGDPKQGGGGQVRVFELEDGTERFDPIVATEEVAMAVRFSPDSSQLVTAAGYGDPVIRIWDARDGKPVGKLEGHRRFVTGLVFTPDGKKLISSSADYTIRIWDWPERRPAGMFRGHRDEVDGLDVSPDGKTLASRCKDGTIHLWDLSRVHDHTECRTFRTSTTASELTYSLATLTFSPGSKSIIEKPVKGPLTTWDIGSLQPSKSKVEEAGPDSFLDVSTDARLMVAAPRIGPPLSFRVFDATSGMEIKTLPVPEGLPGLIPRVAFTGNGRALVRYSLEGLRGPNSTGDAPTIRVVVWDTETWEAREYKHSISPDDFRTQGLARLQTLAATDSFAITALRVITIVDAPRPAASTI
jgi:WD40 repeat protein